MYATIREAAVIYGVAVRTIRYWIRNGKIDAYKLANGRWMVKINDNKN